MWINQNPVLLDKPYVKSKKVVTCKSMKLKAPVKAPGLCFPKSFSHGSAFQHRQPMKHIKHKCQIEDTCRKTPSINFDEWWIITNFLAYIISLFDNLWRHPCIRIWNCNKRLSFHVVVILIQKIGAMQNTKNNEF